MKVSYKDIIDLAGRRNLYNYFSISPDVSIKEIKGKFETKFNSGEDGSELAFAILSTQKYKEVYDQALEAFCCSGNILLNHDLISNVPKTISSLSLTPKLSEKLKLFSKEVQDLVQKGCNQKFITERELFCVMPDVEENLDQLDKLYELILEIGIEVIEVKEEELRLKKQEQLEKKSGLSSTALFWIVLTIAIVPMVLIGMSDTTNDVELEYIAQELPKKEFTDTDKGGNKRVNNIQVEKPIQKKELDIFTIGTPRATVDNYFYYLEKFDFRKAFSVFGEEKRINAGGEKEFLSWIGDLEAITDLKIDYLEDISSSEEKVYLADFNMIFSKKENLDSKWIFYIRKVETGGWYIHKSLVAYENGWKDYACELYSFFKICLEHDFEEGAEETNVQENNEERKEIQITLEKKNYFTKDAWITVNGKVSTDISSLWLYLNEKPIELGKVNKDNGKIIFTNLGQVSGENHDDGDIYLGLRAGEDFKNGNNKISLVAYKGAEKEEEEFTIFYSSNRIVGDKRYAVYSEGRGFFYPKEWDYMSDSTLSNFPVYSVFGLSDIPRTAKADTLNISPAGELQTEELQFFSHQSPKEITLSDLKKMILEKISKRNDLVSYDIQDEIIYFKSTPAVLIKYTEPENSPIREKIYMLVFIKNSEVFFLSYSATVDDFIKKKAENMLNALIIGDTQYKFF